MTDSKNSNATMLQQVLRMLDKDKRSTAQIASAAGLPYNWLYKLRGRQIPDPSVNRVEKLLNTLNGA